jgi:hypothetical protein
VLVYPFRPLVLIPSTKYLLKNKKIRKTGIKDNVDMANMAPKSVVEEASAKSLMAIDTV